MNVLPGNRATDPDAELGWSTPNTIHEEQSEAGGTNAVSADGSRIFWTDLVDHSLYVRVNGEATVQIDVSQGLGASGGGHFMTANAEGTKVFFTDESRLTADSTAAAGEPDLYECELVEAHGTLECALSDLTLDAHADVLGVLGSSEDGSTLYFVANGVLASGASSGECKEPYAYEPGHQECNLYVWHGEGAGAGSTTFIARLSGADLSNDTIPGGYTTQLNSVPTSGGDTDPQLGWRTAEATPDGRYLAFMSIDPLTGYDNGDPSSRFKQDFEVYVYDVETHALACASCDPSGERPVGSSWLPVYGNAHFVAFTRQPRWLSEDGRVFFDSDNAIIPADSSDAQNVYEYEGGNVYLISSGTTPRASYFDDASPSGNDVFFTTASQLVAQDTDELTDLYDARVDGGIAAQNAASSAPCAGDACRGAASAAPALGSALSQVFSGPGNLAPTTESKTVSTATSKSLTRAQKLAKALKACKKEKQRRRKWPVKNGPGVNTGRRRKPRRRRRARSRGAK